MKNRIILTEENINDIIPGDLIAVTIAENGAMGDPGAVELVNKELDVYCTHFGEIEKTKLEAAIPFLKSLGVFFGQVDGLSEDWEYLYAGYGNYLFLRPGLKDKVCDYIHDHYKDTGLPEMVELYSHWLEALEDVLKNKE